MRVLGRDLPGLLIALAFAVLTVGIFSFLNRPMQEPSFPSVVQGYSFSPYQADQDAVAEQFPSPAEIDADLGLIAGTAHAVRTYSVMGTLYDVPALAERHGLNVTISAWLNKDRDRNEQEIARLLPLAVDSPNVVRVLVGNEVLERNDLPIDELIAHLDRVRAVVPQPVSTAEPWHVWLDHPELANHVDFIAVHLLPYWEGIAVEGAVDYAFSRIDELKRAFPDKPIIVGEIGWPSEGRTRMDAVASTANQARFLRQFLARAERESLVYYVMEAFDQPWKRQTEGGVGAYWGVRDAQRELKFPLAGPIEPLPGWHVLAGVTAGLSLALAMLLLLNSQALRNRGRTFLATVAFATVATAVWIVYDYSQQYLTPASVAIGVLLVVGMAGVMAVLLAEAHEWAEAHWVDSHARLSLATSSTPRRHPKVSIHVPAYNEPPDMLIATLDALSRLDYPNYEVLVIDNNTPDESTWRPVEAHCRSLGRRFRFFNVRPLAGFKAGALNYALRQTCADAEIIAVIDADYQVEPDWLRDLVPAFARESVAIVQAPQDYRDDGDSAFKAMCHAEYRGFFQVGMITRNERNAIIQHGTMTMVRRTALEAGNGWAEWCITEDAELGLRLFAAGHEALYVPTSYGRGLMPDTFDDFRKQRFRWAYGAMQILRAHARALFSGTGSQLTPGQRYHFIAGWLPWIADGFNLVFNLAAIGWSIAMLVAPTQVDPPLLVFTVLPLTLFTFKLVKLVHLYRVRVGAGVRQTAAAAIAGLGLAHTIGLAVLKGLVTRDEPFFRTPKQASRARVTRAIVAAREELLLGVALVLAAVTVAFSPATQGPDLSAWIAALSVQSLPYFAAVFVSIVSALNLPASWIGCGYRESREVAPAPAVVMPLREAA